ncbi:MAG: hypothetical protein NWF04_07005 [Candidatus Bathyarchaeota archaeon]|nr:hypothetical protein [Candidatus Bathyarchaeota archaeon]
MTICIATICGDPKNVIVASDRMMTAGDLSVAFEHESPKITRLTDNCLALTAGPALAHTDLFRLVKNNIHIGASPPVSEIVEKVKEEYLQIRNRCIEEQFFKTRGFTIDWFNLNQRTLNPEIAMRLDHTLETYRFDLSILIAGVDNLGAHIYYIYPPCCSECFDSLGYCSIGSGERHADSTFVAYRYAPSFSLKDGLYITYEAKRKSEIAVGVGRSTDMAIVTEKGISFMHDEILSKLQEMYEEKTKAETLKKDGIEKILDDLSIFGDDKK